ncbi:hypothetical protein AaE_001089 [Aphanomyces astaci]|uniref:Uncharacterized protein n=1 Tax=Aphanomyces astaci TaxID=112090 RepID=A0A6A5AXS6_APHAT|nr:hypothetical protein AaE_001089 [Aphanomyces astaci]
MKMGRNFFRPTSTDHANRYFVDHVTRTFSIVAFKYGNRVCTSADLNEFNQQCVLPRDQDRAGAASEVSNQDMVRQLKQAWSGSFTATEATWRMWAATILRKPTHEHTVLVRDHPPTQMIHLFDSVSNGAQHRNANVQRSLVLARDVVQTAHEDLARICADAEGLVVRCKAGLVALEVKRRTIESSLDDVTRLEHSGGIPNILQDIPNTEDMEHMEF